MSRAIADLIDRIKTSHAASKVTAFGLGVKVELAGVTVVLEECFGGWKVSYGGSSREFTTIKDAGYDVIDALNMAWSAEEARKPKRTSSAGSYSSSGGGGDDGADAVSNMWIDVDDSDD